MNKKIEELNILALAYLGDAIYELHIRDYLIKKGICKVNDLQKESVKFVSANSQCGILKRLLEINFFSDNEISIINRGRNHKGSKHPKNTDIVTYKYATGFEALIGAWYLNDEIDRINSLMKEIVGE